MAALIPVYYQIKQTIKNWIINKEFKPGDKIPSENELAQKFNVSRLTVRQATSQLVQEGFLRSRKGEGTFVTSDENLLNTLTLESIGFMNRFFYQLARSKIKTVKITKIAAPAFLKERLELQEDVPEVLQIRRIQVLEGKPYAYHINYFPLGLGTRIAESDLANKFILQIIEQDLRIEFTETLQTIQASFADQEVAEQLGIAPGSPVLFVESIMYTHKRKPVYVVQSSYRADLYKYIVRLLKTKRKNEGIWYIRSHEASEQ